MLQLELHLLPQLEVQRAERLVEQQHAGPVDQRACQRDPLLLPAGELPGGAAAELFQLHHLQGPRDLLRALGRRHPPHAEAVGDVLPHAHVREQRVVLEDGIDVALERWEGADRRARHEDLALGRPLEPGDHPERRGLARAGGAQQREKLAGRDLQREIIHRRELPEPLGEVAQLQDRRWGNGRVHPCGGRWETWWTGAGSRPRPPRERATWRPSPRSRSPGTSRGAGSTARN